MCEAMITSYEATGEEKYLNKVYRLAKGVTRELADRSGGMVWKTIRRNSSAIIN